MAEAQSPVLAQFLSERPRLRLLAYRLLGSVADADDVVQDAWLKWCTAAEGVRDPAAFLTTQVTRLALDRLRRDARRQRLGAQWVPDPWMEPVEPGESDLSTGLLLLLERLGPDQRAVYVLREAMDLDFAEIAAIVDKTPAACRQIMSRARAALKQGPRRQWDAALTAALVRRFVAACEQRDYAALAALMSEDSRLVSDGGRTVKSARNLILGPDRIARFLLGVRRKFLPGDFIFRTTEINGLPALLGEAEGRIRWVVTFGCADGRIGEIQILADTDRLPAI